MHWYSGDGFGVSATDVAVWVTDGWLLPSLMKRVLSLTGTTVQPWVCRVSPVTNC
jgi:hypothetical protein